MTKTIIAAAMLVAAPATAQTTTTCRNTVANAPSFGVTCDTQPQVQVQPMRQRPQLVMRNWDEEIAYANSLKLEQREMALRERELRVREAEAGIPAPAQPSTGRKLGRALFGF